MCEVEVQIANSGIGPLGDFGFLASMWSGFTIHDFHFDLPEQHHYLLLLVPLDWHDRSSWW